MIEIKLKPLLFFLLLLAVSVPETAKSDILKGKTGNTTELDPAHISVGSHPLQKIELYSGGTLHKIWEDLETPTITAFSVAPTSIDLDSRLTGTITFTIGVTGTAGSNTYAQVVRLPDGTNIGATFVGANGANISSTLPNISQPLQTTSYRLFVHNGAGASHKDTSVTVTKNPTLANCRRTGYIDATTTYYFAFTLTGLPQPVVTYRFSGGQQGTFFSGHLTQGANPYTWTVGDRAWRIAFANADAQSLTLTATNASGSTTCTINNINT